MYDALGNLMAVTLPDGTQIEYIIDGQNRRVGKKVNSVLTKSWLYHNSLKPFAELDGSGNLIALFVYGTSPLTPDYIFQRDTGARLRVVSDLLKSFIDNRPKGDLLLVHCINNKGGRPL